MHLVIPIMFTLYLVLSNAPPATATVLGEQSILPTSGLNWCVLTMGNNSNFRHFINCSTESSFMDLMGLKHGDEIMSSYLALSRRYDQAQLLALLNGIQQNGTFELIFRRYLSGIDIEFLLSNPSIGLLEEMEQRNGNIWYQFTYIRVRVTLLSTRSPGRERRSSAIQHKLNITAKVSFLPGQNLLDIPPIDSTIGTNSGNFICDHDPLDSCSAEQVFKRIITFDFTSSSSMVYARFRLPTTDLYIMTTTETDMEIRPTNSDSEEATYFIVDPVNVRMQLYFLHSLVYPLQYMYEMETHEIRMQTLDIKIPAVNPVFEACFHLWYFASP